ncbi:monooxygenase 1-like [Prunus dulcis]|uniref:monooxygenase 1-like n=1 Tax=Prunus dulcis TaxID=3755 RepID=UPI001481F815|nr:monooxygenase 1-like [Prunus dulcis]XP_034205052.1 monooxygenase 1-like [Prunus dulcis]XP_034205087.1 monooxygenase 1-like [Prunus dulcis]XP_034205108.1 monooxygenase 1-like [Prunus dulcis]
MEIGDTKENIVIVGGGICGLATALALHRKGIRSVVLERSNTLRATGAAIIVHPNGWRALDQLGVASHLRETAIPILSGQFHSLNNDELKEMPVGKEELRCLRRTDLVDILANSLPRNTLHLGCEVLSIKLDPITSSPVLQLQGGRLLNAKVVIGCDGVNSPISNMMGVKAEKIFTISVIRGFTSYPNGHELGSQFRLTKKNDTQVGQLPMTKNLVYWFITRKYTCQDSMASKSQKLIRNLAVDSVEGFPTSIIEMAKNCELDSLHLTEYLRYHAPWDILRRRFRKGTVTLAGDAMHAMGPFLAQGGSACLEDAIVLARCLARTTQIHRNARGTKMQVEKAFDEYLKERKMRVLRLSLQMYLIGKMLDASSQFVKFICIILLAVLFSDSHGHTRYDCGSL